MRPSRRGCDIGLGVCNKYPQGLFAAADGAFVGDRSPDETANLRPADPVDPKGSHDLANTSWNPLGSRVLFLSIYSITASTLIELFWFGQVVS